MSIITIEILLIFLLVILNGVFAMSEIAVISARKARLQQWAESGNHKARLALDLSNSPEDFLSTVQVGITLVGVLAGAFGGATIAQHLAAGINQIALLAPYSETIAIGILVVAITYLSLILGELVPKRVALNNPERIATFIVKPMGVLSRIASPIVGLLSISTNALLWLFRIRRSVELPITEEEIRIHVRQATEAGVLHRDERDIIDRVFRLGDRNASTIMTPRKNLVVLFTSDSLQQLEQKIAKNRHALFPLCEDTLDNVLGIIHAQDILALSLAGKALDLKSIVRQPLFLPESVQSLKLLEEFKSTGKDTALLLDEYGGLQGLITSTDILKAIVGEVSYRDMPKALHRHDGSWLVDGKLPLGEFKDALNIDQPLSVEGQSSETVGGFVMTLLGHIPAEGESIKWNNYRFEIIDMDELRIDKILVSVLTKQEE